MEDWLVGLPLLEKPTRINSCSQSKVREQDSRARHDLSSGRKWLDDDLKDTTGNLG